jgi:hypothetical protein
MDDGQEQVDSSLDRRTMKTYAPLSPNRSHAANVQALLSEVAVALRRSAFVLQQINSVLAKPPA